MMEINLSSGVQFKLEDQCNLAEFQLESDFNLFGYTSAQLQVLIFPSIPLCCVHSGTLSRTWIPQKP